jgi:hypothetical protein
MTSSSSNPGPSPGLRASDADRERVAEALRRHHLDGRLDTDELQERLGRCYAARTGAELAALLADLPAEEERPRAAHASRGWPAGAIVAGVLLVLVALATVGAVGHGHHPGPFPFLAVLLVLKLAWGGPWRRRAWGARRG